MSILLKEYFEDQQLRKIVRKVSSSKKYLKELTSILLESDEL